MFVLFEQTRVFTLPRRLIRDYFRIFGQILEQNQVITRQMAAKIEGRICREVVSCIKWTSSKSPPSTLSSTGHQNEFQRQPSSFGKRDCLLAVGTAESLESRRASSPLVLYK